jgi:hypothetical protein
MTPGRSNGLPAVRYTPLVDLAPHFADALLEALRAEGVAAYAAPAPGRRGPYMDVILPDRPTDRVWVDAAAEADARALLEARRAEFSEPARAAVRASMTEAEDAAWRAIVAGWEQSTTEPVPPWPVAEDLAAGESAAEPAPVRPGPYADEEPLAVQEIPRPPVEADDPEDHFVPPPPPPLPRLEPRTKLAWLGVFLGPVYLVARAWFGIGLFYGASVLVLAAFIGGAVSLIYRMKDDGRDEIDPDDGAVV